MADNEIINTAVEKLGETQSVEMKDSLKGLLSNIFEKGMLPKDAMGMSSNMVEGIYSHAYRLYNTGKYKEASILFRLLILLDPTSPKYPLGLAACFHMVKEYINAASTYMLVSMVDPVSPIPYYHASDCYINLKEVGAAALALEMAIKLSGNLPQYSLIKERSTFTLAGLQEELEAAKVIAKANLEEHQAEADVDSNKK